MKNTLVGWLMIFAIIFISLAWIFKSWLFLIPALVIQLIITFSEKSYNKILTFIIYSVTECLFALINIGIVYLIKLIQIH